MFVGVAVDKGDRCRRSAFTLVELMAVLLVICLLSAIAFGVAGYVQRRVALSTTRAQINAIETALENYKLDWGYYPPTTTRRISHNGFYEQTNNMILCRALFLQGKKYLNFPKSQLHVSYVGTSSNYGYVAAMGLQGATLQIFDVYGTPFNYFCSPQITNALGSELTPSLYVLSSNNLTFFAQGGQVNVASYDLFSYGRDRVTFAGTNADWPSPYNYAAGAEGVPWSNCNAAVDDIANWKQ